MSYDRRYLTLMEAASFMGVTKRWCRRHWPDLVRDGVKVLRVPKDSIKGRLMVNVESLEAYLGKCAVKNDDFQPVL